MGSNATFDEMYCLRSTTQSVSQSVLISRSRPALTPLPARSPVPPLPVCVYTSTEYSLPGATQLSQVSVNL